MSTPVLVQTADGGEKWLLPDGRFHREDKPAIVSADGSRRVWYLHGKLHRLDGPAIERPNGDTEWWVDGHPLTPDDGSLLAGLDPHTRQTALRLYEPGDDVTELVETVTSALTGTPA